MRKSFSVDARVILNLGRDSIKDHTTALLELVKNSYDADASIVEIEILCNDKSSQIRISDNGKGMSEDEVSNNWLRIGFSEKRTNKESDKGRRKTGEKGIGRISTDRLGAIVELKTKAKDLAPCGLRIKWDEFDVDGKELSNIEFEEIRNPVINYPKKSSKKSISGTEIIIRELRQIWSKEDIFNLYSELSIMTSPFQESNDFSIYLYNDVDSSIAGEVVSDKYEQAEIEISAEFDSKSHIIKYTLQNRINKGERINNEITWSQLSQKVMDPFDKSKRTALSCGPVQIRILFFPRSASFVEFTTFTLKSLREFLDIHSGIRIYRDNISVKPYGFPNERLGDWLGIAERRTREPAGIARKGFRVSANQVVGAVFVKRDSNEKLTDSASREGLVDNSAFRDLRALTIGCLSLLENYRHEIYKKNETDKPKQSSVKLLNDYKTSIAKLRTSIEQIYQIDAVKQDEEILQKVDQLSEILQFEESKNIKVDELLGYLQVINGLATLGISSAVFGHETKSNIDLLSQSLDNALRAMRLKNPKYQVAEKQISESRDIADKVAAWGQFALRRIQKDKRIRKRRILNDIIKHVLTEIERFFSLAGISVKYQESEIIESKVFSMDIESILFNLLTNSYTACLNSHENGEVLIQMKKETINKSVGFAISVVDSGTGIAKDILPMIYEPLFTTKKNIKGYEIGTGLGLTIVKSIIEESNGLITVIPKSSLGGAKFTIWMPII